MSEPTIEREDGGPDEYICDDCSTIYPFASLNPMQSFAERVSAGGEVPAGECPDEDCGALCYPVKIEPEVAPTATADKTLQLLRQVAEDARDLISCNCSYDKNTAPEQRCDGTCTHSMAVRALQQLQAQTSAPSWYLVTARHAGDDEDTAYTVQATDASDAHAQVFEQLRELSEERGDVDVEIYILCVVRCGATKPIIERNE